MTSAVLRLPQSVRFLTGALLMLLLAAVVVTVASALGVLPPVGTWSPFSSTDGHPLAYGASWN